MSLVLFLKYLKTFSCQVSLCSRLAEVGCQNQIQQKKFKVNSCMCEGCHKNQSMSTQLWTAGEMFLLYFAILLCSGKEIKRAIPTKVVGDPSGVVGHTSSLSLLKTCLNLRVSWVWSEHGFNVMWITAEGGTWGSFWSVLIRKKATTVFRDQKLQEVK